MKTHQTIYLDPIYGSNSSGRLEDPSHPFRTLKSALKKLTRRYPYRTTSWSLILAPGLYHELVDLPSYVDLIGTGPSTIIQGLKISSPGPNSISSLTIHGVVDLDLRSKNINQQIVLEHLSIISSGISVSQSQGVDGRILFQNLDLSIDLSSLLPGDYSAINHHLVSTTLDSCQIRIIGHYQSTQKVIHARSGNVRVQGGSASIQIPDRMSDREQILYLAEGADLQIRNHQTTYLETPLEETIPGPDVIYLQTISSSTVIVMASSITYNIGEGMQRAVLAEANASSSVNLYQMTVCGVPYLPRIRGEVKYHLTSERGNMLISGGLYTQIKRISSDYYIVQDADSALLVETPECVILLPDPKMAEQEVVYTGKIIQIKNISPGSSTVNGENDSLWDGKVMLAFKEVGTFRADDRYWYRF